WILTGAGLRGRSTNTVRRGARGRAASPRDAPGGDRGSQPRPDGVPRRRGSVLRAEEELLGDAPRPTGHPQVALLELGGGPVVAVDEHRERPQVVPIGGQHVALLALPQEQPAPDL